jgi:hypothetical protein
MVATRNVATGLGEIRSSLPAGESVQGITVLPNPVTDKTTIRFNLPAGSYVTLKLLDAEGQPVHTFIRQFMSQGTNELPFNTSLLKQNPATGIYYLTLQTDKVFNSVKVVLAK